MLGLNPEMSVFEILKKIARISSPSGHEEPLVDYIEYSVSGYNEVLVEPIGGYSYNVIIGDLSERPKLALVAHLDTIGREGRIKISGDVIEGPGIIDDKASVAVLLKLALEGIKEVQIALLSQEETTGMGSYYYLKGFSPKRAIVMEPTRNVFCTSGAGMITGEIVAYGEELHPDLGYKGRNAIETLLEAFSIIKGRLPKGVHITPLGVSSPDTNEFYTPSVARMTVDINVPPGKMDEALRSLHEAMGEIERIDAEFRVTDIAPPFELEDEEFLNIINKISGETCSFFGRCDANNFSERGIPSVVFGPGDYERIHTERERVSKRELEEAYRILKKIINELV